MLFSATCTLFFLLGETSAIVSQMTLTIMLVSIGVLMIGISFPRSSKTRQSLLQHRWTLTVSTMLTLLAAFLVMAPSAFKFYIDPAVNPLSVLFIMALIHAAVGAPALIMALIYAFGDLPQNIRSWMRTASALWIVAMAIGVLLFLHVLALV